MNLRQIQKVLLLAVFMDADVGKEYKQKAGQEIWQT